MENEVKKGTRILIVDDDAFLLDMYSIKFTQNGFAVSTCPGTLEALEKLRNEEAPEVLLVDIVMPAMDGFEFLAKINEEGLATHATKIVLSNLGQQEDIDKGIALGASGYIVKASATPSEVVTKVEEVLQKHKKK